MYGMVLVKAQATKQKGIAMRLLLTIFSALLLSANVTTSEEIRGTCTITHVFGIKGSEPVFTQYPEDAGIQQFFQINGDTLLFREDTFVEEFQKITTDYRSQTFMKIEAWYTKLIQIINPECERSEKDQILVWSLISSDLIQRSIADCPCKE